MFNIQENKERLIASKIAGNLKLGWEVEKKIYDYLKEDANFTLYYQETRGWNKHVRKVKSFFLRLSCIPYFIITVLCVVFSPIKYIFTGTISYNNKKFTSFMYNWWKKI